ncbi:MAG: cobalamin biosynthesis protein CobD [Desulfuromonadales bacterium]|nr:cobalamin biosynthesis protein CobD [Desulfuromonadales bacterium]
MTTALLVAAWGLDLLLGDPRSVPHPVVAIGRLIRRAEAFWPKVLKNRRQAGIALTLSVLALTAATTWGILFVTATLAPWLTLLATIWLSYTCLATRSLHRESAKVICALEAGDLAGARLALSWIVSRNTQELGEEAILRATCETVAENTSDGIIAPLLYLALGGPILGMTYKAASTLDSMVGYKNEQYLQLGWASARLDDLLNLIPARLTVLLIALCAPLVGLSSGQALQSARHDGNKSSSPNAGYPMAAMAGALGVSFGGAATYFGERVEKPILGRAHHPLTLTDYHRTIRLMYAVSLSALLLCGGLLLLLSKG